MLAIETARGKAMVEMQGRAARLFTRAHPQIEVRFTPADQPAVIDALMFRAGELCAVAEIKCRAMTEAQLQGLGGEWLVTHEKIVAAKAVAASHAVPLYGLLYLIPEDVLLSLRLTDREGRLVVPFRVDITETQATVNGGTAVRANAYIPMGLATRIAGEGA